MPQKFRNSGEFYMNTNQQNVNDYVGPATESPSTPPYQPDQFSYVPQHQPPYQPYYTYQQYPTYQQQLPPQIQPQPQPQPQQQYIPSPPSPSSLCGSSLLFSCQPQVRPVSCYESSPYGWPTSLPATPPPPPQPLQPPAVSYTPSTSYSNRRPSSPARPYDVPVDVYMRPGPPYLSEPNLGSAALWQHAVRAKPAQSDSKVPSSIHDHQRTDSRPASSNSEKKTESHSTTEMNIVTTTTAATPAITVTTESDNMTTLPPPSPLSTTSPLTDEQIDKFAEKLNSHVESLEKFRAMARKKLREAMARTSASDEEFTQFFDPQSFQKRHSLMESNPQQQSNPQFTNSVW